MWASSVGFTALIAVSSESSTACPELWCRIFVWVDFALRGGQAIRRETGMPRAVTMLMSLQATLAWSSVSAESARGGQAPFCTETSRNHSRNRLMGGASHR